MQRRHDVIHAHDGQLLRNAASVCDRRRKKADGQQIVRADHCRHVRCGQLLIGAAAAAVTRTAIARQIAAVVRAVFPQCRTEAQQLGVERLVLQRFRDVGNAAMPQLQQVLGSKVAAGIGRRPDRGIALKGGSP